MIYTATKTVIINPRTEFHMLGYISPERQLPALGVKEDLRAVLLLLEVEQKKMLFVSLDILSISKERTSALRRSLAERLKIAPEFIVISAIHTHSGPTGISVDAMGQFGTDHPDYADYVTEIVTEASCDLPDRLEETEAEIGRTVVHGYYDNRNCAGKPFDDTASVILFRNRAGRIAAAMVNLNCHSTILGPSNRYASGDLLGKVRDLLADDYGVVPYIFAGTIADISNRHYRRGNDFAELLRVGTGVAEILKDIHDFQPLKMDKMEVRTFRYPFAYHMKNYAADYQRQLDAVEHALQGELSSDQRKLRLSEKSKLLAKLAMDRVDFTVECRIYDIGDLRLITYPGELTSVFGAQIRAKSDKCTLIIAYANDHHGYFLEQEEFGHCYESIASLAPRGETEKMIDKLGEIL